MFLEMQVLYLLVWFRYKDDVFLFGLVGRDSFLEKLNKSDLNLQFTHETSKESISFLGLRVVLSNVHLLTDMHIKSSDRHQFEHFTSSHPDHTKRSIIYRQALRISRISSNKSDF